MPWTRAEFASLDFEATGLDFERDTIVSFAVVPIRGGVIDVGDAVYDLVHPGEVHQSPDSVAVHMLRPVDLEGAQSLDAAREQLRRAIEGRFLLTWFASIEARFLTKLYGGSPRRWLRRSVDARKLAAALDRLEGRPAESYALPDVADRYGVPVAHPHDALDDALVTAQLFLVTASRLAARHGYASVRHLLAETAWAPPILLRPRAPT